MTANLCVFGRGDRQTAAVQKKLVHREREDPAPRMFVHVQRHSSEAEDFQLSCQRAGMPAPESCMPAACQLLLSCLCLSCLACKLCVCVFSCLMSLKFARLFLWRLKVTGGCNTLVAKWPSARRAFMHVHIDSTTLQYSKTAYYTILFRHCLLWCHCH